jgi:S-disulfanyl-L-cysteine oxidoreductase SoxD
MRGATTTLRTAVLALAGIGLFAAGRAFAPAERPAGGESARSATAVHGSAEPAPTRFGVGRAATAAEIAALDIDVAPDGTGLPPGRGAVAEGAALYAAQCAACHGPRGEGTPVGTRLTGREPLDSTGWNRTIGNYWPWATSLFDYIRRAMPFDRPGSLTADEVYAATAYLLFLNDLVPGDAVVDAGTLPQVVMPARDLFRDDDREASSRVR